MAEEDLEVVEIQENFYRDSFGKVIFIIVCIFIAIASLVGISIYLYVNPPPPVVFAVYKEWRVQPEIPVNQPYLSNADMLQWVSDAMPNAFNYSFLNYNGQLQNASQYFTSNGWKVFLDQLNIHVNYNTVQKGKLYVTGTLAGAPIVLDQGLVSGRYAWRVQIPITINYVGNNVNSSKTLTMELLVVRVSTLNNLNGVGIDNVLVLKNTEAVTSPLG